MSLKIPLVLALTLLLGSCVGGSSGDSSSLSPPATLDCSSYTAFGDLLLCYVNQARSTAQDCDGNGSLETPAPGHYLAYNGLLESVATDHTGNMALNDFEGHFTDNLATVDPNGDADPSDPNFLDANGDGFNDRWVTGRVLAKGYAYSALAENVARGQNIGSAQLVVAAWMASQSHCENIMSPLVTEMGGAVLSNGAAIPFYYWTLVMAKPAP